MRTSDADLYRRGIETVLACWEENGRGAPGASVVRSPGVASAVFPSSPERLVYNNAVLDGGMDRTERAAAIEAMEAAYATAGVVDFAAWVHESDEGMKGELLTRGYSLNESTVAMEISLVDLPITPPRIELGPPDWFEYLRLVGIPGLLPEADPDAFHILIARLDGRSVATAMAFDHQGDCGIFNVGTLESARRRGIATALTALHLHNAAARGCQTASLQSTEPAEGIYAALGFRALGRILEYVPRTTSSA